MVVLVLQDEFAPLLLARGFVRTNKVFRRTPGDGMGMTVWLNPENRLKHVRTVNVDCWVDDEDQGWLYSLDQARAVSEIERRGAWASFDYTPDMPDWPAVIVDDFERVTLPFIDACTSPAALCDLLLEGRVPPSNMKRAPVGWFEDVWSIADRARLSGYGDTALERLGSLQLTRSDHDNVQWWAVQQGIDDLVLNAPLPSPRRWFGSRRQR
ncbi:hypothetical protein ACWFNS_10095 [Oerskovia enterophila]